MTNSLIYLDVGGQIFKTSYQTLILAPYFQSLEHINGQILGSRLATKEQPYFIDRDPEIFRHVLNLLRNPNYNFPTEYLEELAFWGISIETATDQGRTIKEALSGEVTNNSLIRTPPMDRLLLKTMHEIPEITYHLKTIRPATFYTNPLNRHDFNKLPWTLEINDEIIGNCYILIPRAIHLNDLINFEIEIKYGNSTATYYNRMHLHPYLTGNYDEYSSKIIPKSVVTIDGYHYVPISILINTNNFEFPILLTTEKKISLTLSHSTITELSTAICYYTPIINEFERTKMTRIMNLDIQNYCEIPIHGDTVELPSGFVRFLFWKTNEVVDQVSLISTPINSIRSLMQPTATDHPIKSYILKRGDFQYLERIKVGLEVLPDTYGSMYFCKHPTMVDNSGGLDLDQTYSLKFPKAVTGYLWIATRQLWLFRRIAPTPDTDENNLLAETQNNIIFPETYPGFTILK